jgi:hypothetical protein
MQFGVSGFVDRVLGAECDDGCECIGERRGVVRRPYNGFQAVVVQHAIVRGPNADVYWNVRQFLVQSAHEVPQMRRSTRDVQIRDTNQVNVGNIKITDIASSDGVERHRARPQAGIVQELREHR